MPMPRVLRGSWEAGLFLMGEVPLYTELRNPLSSDLGTNKPVRTRFRSWLSSECSETPSSCPLCARQRLKTKALTNSSLGGKL